MNHIVSTRISARHGRPVRRSLLALLAVTMAGLGVLPAASPAHAVEQTLDSHGPVDHATGYPFWFADGGAAGLDPVRLELCVDDVQDPLCPVVGEPPVPGAELSVPENYPDESFYWSGEAAIETGGVRARLILAMEAAFGGTGEVAVGQQTAFQRLRVRIDDLPPGQTYTVTSPYGVDQVESDDRGRVFMTEDHGCMAGPCGFDASLSGRVGPFLRWDPAVGPDAPEGYVGDPNIEHTVVGSPFGTNIFRVEGPDAGGPGVDVIETDLFTVQGRIARPRATVDLPGDIYAAGTQVSIMPSFPGESEVHWTLTPTGTTTGEPVEGSHESTGADPAAVVPLPLGEHDLTYHVEHDGQLSEEYVQHYTVRENVSVVTATPDASQPLEGLQEVELTGSMEGPVFYTTDGTRPRVDGDGDPLGSTREYTDPLVVGRSTLVKAISVPSADGELPGPVATFGFTIHNLRAISADRIAGYPATLTDIGLPSATDPSGREGAVELELCLDDPLCPVVGELPDPTRGVSFPDNFPGESFWWAAEAAFPDAAGEDVQLTLAAEAAFTTEDAVDGEQVAFGRIRVRYDDGEPGATYRFMHPYGVVVATADDRGRVRHTEDIGCMTTPCGDEGTGGTPGFSRMLSQPVGPFLRWDPAVAPAAPAGYVGDPNLEHSVIGSPYGTNEFVVDQLTDGDGDPLGSPRRIGETDQFAVQGQLAGRPGVVASHQTGTFPDPFSVTLTGNGVTDEIRYTLDGTVPDADSGLVYDGPIEVGPGLTQLTYVGIAEDGTTSTPEVEDYAVELRLTATPAGATFDRSQTVVLEATDPAVDILFTTDGSDPLNGQAYEGPITLDRTTTVRATAVNDANRASGQWTFTDDQAPAAPAASPNGGTFTQTQSVALSTDDPGATIRWTTGDGDPATGQVYTGPVNINRSSTLNAVAIDRTGNASPLGEWDFTIVPPTVTATGPASQVVTLGEGTGFAGTLTSGGAPLAGATVQLQSRPATLGGAGTRASRAAATGAAAGWTVEETTTTDAQGGYAFADRSPGATRAYRVFFPGDALHPEAAGSEQLVQVRAVTSLTAVPRRVSRLARIRLRGSLEPAHRGTRVTVLLDGPGRRAQRLTARVRPSGAWRLRTRAPRKPGRWVVTAQWAGDADHLGSTSNRRVMRVRRR